jgi:hypothetical protein
MKNWKTIPVPNKMQDLPTERGYPVSVIILHDETGKAHFKINDSRKVDMCMYENLCTICGKKLDDDKWMIGGPVSAFHPGGVYVDAPVHKECGEYALKVCPYLAVSRYTQQIDIEKLGTLKFDGGEGYGFVNMTQSDERVPFFVFSKVKKYEVTRRGFNKYLIPEKPFLEIEYWTEGEQISKEEAGVLFKRWQQETKDFKNVGEFNIQ